jgi:hypothetical protein
MVVPSEAVEYHLLEQEDVVGVVSRHFWQFYRRSL